MLRFLKPWSKTIREPYSPILARQPWISFPATDFLTTNLTANQRVFEFGGGGSTLFYLDKGLRVITAEHNAEWFKKIQQLVKFAINMSTWQGILLTPCQPNRTEMRHDFSDPNAYNSSDAQSRDLDFYNYASSIDAFLDESFDLVTVDGRARPSCLKHGASKVKRGGYLLLDNTERAHYVTPKIKTYLEEFEIAFDCFGPVAGLLDFTRTTIWKKILQPKSKI
jgi:hypothetical protein